jgi:hypothetical protein
MEEIILGATLQRYCATAALQHCSTAALRHCAAPAQALDVTQVSNTAIS